MTHSYENPLTHRYASKEMSHLFSPQFKFKNWRKLWLALAEAQKQEGLNITAEQISELKTHLDDIDFDYAAKKEKELRHDVMAHVHTYAKQCPKSAPIIHLGATSAYVGDNTDLIQIKAALELVEQKIKSVIFSLKTFALKHKDRPTLGFTHFQPAQLTTVGKRACLWIQELLLDLEETHFLLANLPFRGVKGTTGTQASFLKLFAGDEAKVDRVNDYVRKVFDFKRDLFITGQTYTRKIDYKVTSLLASIAQSAAKFSGDMRLLANLKEMEEPFEDKQIGSSAMAYKRNPMRCERLASLARFVISLPFSTAYTASTQWFERTLDDSANKRLAIPQAFLAVDAILDIYRNVVSGLVVYEKVIEKNIHAELPFMATENIIMESVKRGANRQEVHEEIRVLSMKASEEIKINGGENTLLEMIGQSKIIPLSSKELTGLLKPEHYTGRSSSMVVNFVKHSIDPALKNFDGMDEPNLKV